MSSMKKSERKKTMKIEKRFYLNIFYVVIGAALLACGIFEIVDSFWSGMGGALIGVGTIVFKIAGNDLLSQYCAYSVCGILILYWVAFLFLRKKY